MGRLRVVMTVVCVVAPLSALQVVGGQTAIAFFAKYSKGSH